MTNTPVTNQSPLHQLAAATDTKLADLYNKQWYAGECLSILDSGDVRRAAGQSSRYEGGRYKWDGTLDEALAKLEEVALGDDVHARYAARTLQKRNDLLAQISKLDHEILPLEQTYKQHRWSRFYLVLASNGHIHSSRQCSTCYATTNFEWVTNLSGLTEYDAVQQEGEILCTVCFPSAPVDWTQGASRRDTEARAKREAEAKARLDAKIAKALTADGSEFIIRTENSTEVFKTARSAEIWAVNGIAYKLTNEWFFKPYAYSAENLQAVLALLTAKKGDGIVDELTAKARVKVRKAK